MYVHFFCALGISVEEDIVRRDAICDRVHLHHVLFCTQAHMHLTKERRGRLLGLHGCRGVPVTLTGRSSRWNTHQATTGTGNCDNLVRSHKHKQEVSCVPPLPDRQHPTELGTVSWLLPLLCLIQPDLVCFLNQHEESRLTTAVHPFTA
jgi:hypothetical protein